MSDAKGNSEICCGGRTRKQWYQILGFYLFFYLFVIAFWAICFQVMIETQPPIADGPKSQFIINPSGLPTPSRISVTLSDYENSVATEYEELSDFVDRDGTNSLSLDNGGVFGACEMILTKNFTTTYEVNNPCVFMSLSRVFGQPTSNLGTQLFLDFPSLEQFEIDFGMSFANFAAANINISPVAFNGAAPFGGPGSNYVDLVSAIQIDYSSYIPAIMAGNMEINIRLGFRFLDGTEEYAVGTVDIDVRP